MSECDIKTGTIWRDALARALGDAQCGVVCVTRQTMRSLWVMFETGVLSATKGCTVFPYLIGLKATELRGPLSEVHSREANEDGTWHLVEELNGMSPAPRGEEELSESFHRWWPDLEQTIRTAPEDPPDDGVEVTYNVLDNTGLEKLLQVHFYAAADRLMFKFGDHTDQFTRFPEDRDFALLVGAAVQVITAGRLLLAPFRHHSIGPLSKFLERCLPIAELRERLEDGLALVARRADPVKMRKDVYQLIQDEQTRLRKIVNDRLQGEQD